MKKKPRKQKNMSKTYQMVTEAEPLSVEGRNGYIGRRWT